MKHNLSLLSLALLALSAPVPAHAEERKAAEEPVLNVPAPVPATPPNAAGAAAGTTTTAPAGSTAPADGVGAAAVGDSTGWNAEVAPGKGVGLTLDDKQLEIVKKVSTYFNELASLKGAFVQTASDNKRMKGKFYLKRPGRFRFDYSLPSKQIVISDGEYLAIQDLDLNNEDRVELDQTPFRLLMRKDVDIARDARILELQEASDLIVLALQDKSPDAPGRIKLFISTQPELEIKEWVTTDAQGVDTRVEVSQLVKGEDLDGKLFKIEPVSLNKFHPSP
jgi:outer membrane lipoprotein-sorting protein